MTPFNNLDQSQRDDVRDNVLADQICWDGTTLLINGEPHVKFEVGVVDGEYVMCDPYLLKPKGMR